MASLNCPLCRETYENDADLRIHLEVEHRKSAIVEHLVSTASPRTDPVIESDDGNDIEEAPSPV